jgi:[ribosomal protein S5]-alanine N-acetyltransferase
MNATGLIARTPRLQVRMLSLDDAGFIVQLLNQPDFLRFIGDRGVRDVEQARSYLREGPLTGYALDGHGLNAVELHDGTLIGLCGLLRRDGLPGPDIGFAYLPSHYGQGYACEAGEAVLAHARHILGIERVLAIVSPDNTRSIALLRRLGLRDAGTVTLPGKDEALLLFETAQS